MGTGRGWFGTTTWERSAAFGERRGDDLSLLGDDSGSLCHLLMG